MAGRLVGAWADRASFVPPRPIQELRDLTRTRKQLVRQVAYATLRIQKTLDDANIKVTDPPQEAVSRDVATATTAFLGPRRLQRRRMGTSGRALLRAWIAGETDPERLLAQTTGRLRAPRRLPALRPSGDKGRRSMLVDNEQETQPDHRRRRQQGGQPPGRQTVDAFDTHEARRAKKLV